MINFKRYARQSLNEAIRSADFPAATKIIRKYLSKYVGHVYSYPTPERYTGGGKNGVGIRFYLQGNKSIRLNWRKSEGIKSSAGLDSMDYWDGSMTPQPTPTKHIEFKYDQSLATALPFVKDFLLGKVDIADGVFINEETESFFPLVEAAHSREDIAHTLNVILNNLKMGLSFRQQDLAGGKKKYGAGYDKLKDTIKSEYASLFKKQGITIIIDKDDVDKIDSRKILDMVAGPGTGAVSYKITTGSKETVEVDGASEEDVDRLTYEEQLEALKTGMKLLMSNATNAMFVGGRGGTGKTQTIEDMLHEAGKEDGDGYFKITGSATPVGIYRILYNHRRDIVLFDDSDSAFNDQEGRNLFKAASDTKKVRKISWMKGGKNFVDPADFDEDNEDETLPRYFEFTGKIIFISNLPLNKLDPDGALRTRGYVMNVDPTNEEIYDFMLKIADKIPLDVDYTLSPAKRQEVVEVLKSRKTAEKTANLRSLVRALNTRAGVELQGGTEEEWKKFVKIYA